MKWTFSVLPEFNNLTREDRQDIYLEISTEIVKSSRYVFVRYSRNQFIIGKTCYSHHILVCKGTDGERSWNPAPQHWLWANCGLCFRQEILAKRHEHIPNVSVIIHWARLTSRLVLKSVDLSKWRCTAKTPEDYIPLSNIALAHLYFQGSVKYEET